ncbi:MAG TPA: heme biosynthesis HemY N-terminal domain-containing protein [Casimicrobiaceae bacterium]|nr:heme biosynthesis HemY N-terminal domain-containing protein [Casimicrobiaceae bacterium]
MRALLLFLLLAAVAVALALFARVNAGYVLFVAPPYRLELSINAFVIFALAAFAFLYAVLRFAARLARLPKEVRDHRRAQQTERARAKQDAALVGLLEGRFGRARQAAADALAIPRSSGLAALIGARAAIEMRDFAGASALLARPDAQLKSLSIPRLMLESEIALETGRTADALARLAELKRDSGAHTAAVRLELRTLSEAGRHADVPPLIDQLEKRKVYDAAQASLLRASAHADALRSLFSDAAGLRAYWNKLAESDRTLPNVASAAARSFVAHGMDREAAEICARSLERHWDGRVALRYAECRVPDATRQLERAESWLDDHRGDALLLRALGRLCERRELWGKAETYYEASLALEDSWRTRIALGEMLARIGRRDAANANLAAALKLALAELTDETLA